MTVGTIWFLRVVEAFESGTTYSIPLYFTQVTAIPLLSRIST